MIEDEVNMRLASFYVTPVKRLGIAFGYIFSAWCIAVFLCTVTLAVSQVYFAVTGQTTLVWTALLQLLGMIVLNAFVYAAIAYFIALFVHSVGAWNGILSIVGTLVGFVGAIYLPMSVLPESVADILRHLPVLHGAATIVMGDEPVSFVVQAGCLLALGLLMIAASAVISRRKLLYDR